MPYRIGLDSRMIRHTGIGTYLRGLVSGFASADIPNRSKPALFGPKDLPAQYPGFQANPFTAPIYSIGEQLSYPFQLGKCALWHAPHYNVPLVKGKTKLVVTIHDIIHWIFRKQFLSPLQELYAGTMMRRALSLADHIISVSHHTKKDLVEHFRADPKKITVIHEGARQECRELPPHELTEKFAALKEKYGLPDDLFLYVGLMKPHKNVLWLIRLFRKLRLAKKLRSTLVLVGRKDKKYPRGYEELQGLGTFAGVIHIPEIGGDELITLYNQALALVHPSLYEGFGLTVLEAMKCGTPVITSKAASLPEVAGDAAILVDPTSDEELAGALMEVESSVETRNLLRTRGLGRAALFNWRETARQTVQVYEGVLAGR
jgi:glycosyltransferase involved in cell wall biosynthesis